MTHLAFAEALLEWFDRAGRTHLPWQQDRTPYRVWVSEIMLQQTQVGTVIPYYERFIKRFGTVHELAAAPSDEVLHLWTGLGYYARARNLHKAAQIIVEQHSGHFPGTIEAVQALPGIGRSTAGAILSLACEQRHPILDGNVKRVLARYFGIEGFPGERRTEQRLWALADANTPAHRVSSYTQAIMDFGATLCTRTRPQCPSCPVQGACVAYRDQLQTSLPTPRPKRTRPRREAFIVIALDQRGAVLLERRPPSGIWGGLWTFPQFEDEATAQIFAGSRAGADELPAYHHAFTHFDLSLRPLLLRDLQLDRVADAERYRWFDPRDPAQIGLAKPVTDIIRLLAQRTLV